MFRVCLLILLLTNLAILFDDDTSHGRALGDFTESLTDESLLNILTPCISFSILILFGVGSLKSTSMLAASVLEEMSENASMKEFVSSSLTNVGVVSALVLSIVIAQMQVDSPHSPATMGWNVYVGSCFLSSGFAVQGVVISALALLYLQGLDEAQCRSFISRLPHAVGFPLSNMVVASLLLILQSILYVGLVGNTTVWMYSVIAGGICFFNVFKNWNDFASFRNTDVPLEVRQQRRRAMGVGKTVGFLDWLGLKKHEADPSASLGLEATCSSMSLYGPEPCGAP